jgi:hypothetical protein
VDKAVAIDDNPRLCHYSVLNREGEERRVKAGN